MDSTRILKEVVRKEILTIPTQVIHSKQPMANTPETPGLEMSLLAVKLESSLTLHSPKPARKQLQLKLHPVSQKSINLPSFRLIKMCV